VPFSARVVFFLRRPGFLTTEFLAPLDDLAVNDPERFDRLFIDRLSKSLIVTVAAL
jgi:hypothetical protein